MKAISRELELLADICNEKGISKLSWSDVGIVSIEFFSARPVALPAELVQESKPEVEEKPGKDGLTKAEQIELYGRVMDTE